MGPQLDEDNFSNELSDEELVAKSQNGDKEAFEQLVIRNQDLVFSLAFKLSGNRDLANDIAQEAFIRAWRAIKKFRGDSAFSTWIYRITVNTAWTLRKKAKKHYVANIDDSPEPIEIDPNVINPSCNGFNDGSSPPTVSGGVPPYETSWIGTPNGQNLSAGFYDFSVF